MLDALFSFFWELLYQICSLLCWLTQCIYETFEVFAGLRMVKYNSEDTYLINVFFGNDAVSRIYWGMAAIGIVLCFAFGIVAVIRKMFDSEDKMQTTLGAIVGSMIKSILLILMMNFIITVVVNATNLLMQQVDYAFGGGVYAESVSGKTVTFSEEDYATMARIYNTIGNYSLNPSYDSRINVNSCFNDIRKDMLLLDDKYVFEYDYEVIEYGVAVECWQSVLVPIARARTLNEDIAIDEYDEGLMNSMLHAMEILQSGSNFTPLSSYTAPGKPMVDADTRLDAIVMLTGTMNAAKNQKYNETPGIFDTLRSPYITGEKDIHSVSQIKKDFKLSEFEFLMIIIAACFLGYQMIFIAINAIARIFNMILLYLVAPPIIAASPLDGGAKMKQWTTAFVVQSLSIFGALMAMRLITFCIPIIYSDSLVLFPEESAGSGVRNYIIKLFFLLAISFTANKSIGMISGILADSAGWQSINAGNVGDTITGDLKSGYGSLKEAANFITGKNDNDKEQENKGKAGERDNGASGGSSGGNSSGNSSSGGNSSGSRVSGGGPQNNSNISSGSDGGNFSGNSGNGNVNAGNMGGAEMGNANIGVGNTGGSNIGTGPQNLNHQGGAEMGNANIGVSNTGGSNIGTGPQNLNHQGGGEGGGKDSVVIKEPPQIPPVNNRNFT